MNVKEIVTLDATTLSQGRQSFTVRERRKRRRTAFPHFSQQGKRRAFIPLVFPKEASAEKPGPENAEASLPSKKAKGKRLTTYQVDTINELEPTRFPEEEQVPETEAPEELEEAMPDEPDENPEDLRDEIVGQMKLFDN